MRFITITLIVHTPDPFTGAQKSTRDRFREVLDSALLAEQLGFDGFGVGERHERPFISSSPTVVLSHVAALTRRIRLFTAVTTLSLLDPVRAFEDYATLDQLSGGRLELIIGKGNGAAQRELFADAGGLTQARHRASLELFQSDIAPVLRREIPDPPWGWGGGPPGDDTVPAGYSATIQKSYVETAQNASGNNSTSRERSCGDRSIS
jgi:alkanesulfonate monooxygenase SsuD/methylene tetrahydromethanopterin reductase-like flavin-dependent oxidoreductase (luciferase family)